MKKIFIISQSLKKIYIAKVTGDWKDSYDLRNFLENAFKEFHEDHIFVLNCENAELNRITRPNGNLECAVIEAESIQTKPIQDKEPTDLPENFL